MLAPSVTVSPSAAPLNAVRRSDQDVTVVAQAPAGPARTAAVSAANIARIRAQARRVEARPAGVRPGRGEELRQTTKAGREC